MKIYYPELSNDDQRIHDFSAAVVGEKISPADLVGHIQAHSMNPDLDLILDEKQFLLDCRERQKIMIEIKEESEVELEQKENGEEDDDDDVCPKTGATIAKNVVAAGPMATLAELIKALK